MKNINLTKNENKTTNIILIITSVLTLFIGISFFLEKNIKFIEGNEIFYVAMLMYFGLEFTKYLLTRKITGNISLYTSLACIIASVSGVLYIDEKTSLVLSYTLVGWMIIMIIIKLIKIEDLRKELNNGVFVNLFSLSLFIMLGFLVITNIYKEITNPNMMLGFFYTVNGVLNIIENIADIKFRKK